MFLYQKKKEDICFEFVTICLIHLIGLNKRIKQTFFLVNFVIAEIA